MDVQALLAQPLEHIVRQEPLTQSLIGELLPLLTRHYLAISATREFPLLPRWNVYYKLQEMGMLVIVTARADGRLTGYLCFIVDPHLHYETMVTANQDVWWVDEEFRKGSDVGLRLEREAMEILLDRGVDYVMQHSKTAWPIDRQLEYLGYKRVESIYGKRIS